MKRISLLLLAIVSCHAADYNLPPSASDTLVIGGVEQVGVSPNKVKVGGGHLWASGKFYSGQNVLEADFVLGDNSAGRRVELGTNATGRGQLRLRDTTGTISVNLLAGASSTLLGEAGNSGAEATAAIRLGNVGASNKFVSIGYDSVADAGYLQALHSGVTNKPLRLQPNGNVAIVGADPGGSEILRVGGEIHCAMGPTTTTGLRITGAYPGIKLESTTAISDVGITYAKSGKAYCVGAAIGENSNNFVFWDATASAARGRIRSNGEWEFLGPTPTTIGASQTVIGGGRVFSSSLVGVGDLNGGGLRGGRYSAGDPNLYVIGGWLPGGEGVRAGIKFSTTPTSVAAPNANSPTRMEIEPDGLIRFLGTAPSAGVNVGEVLIGGGRVMIGGTLSAKEVRVTTTGADYVFEEGYELRSLAEVEQFIAKEKHLPEMMSAKEMQANGMPVSEVVTKQLAKIEELTLYVIQAQKERDAAQAQAAAQALATREQFAAQEARIQRLEGLLRNLAPAVTP